MKRDETVALFLQGKDAWNAWAETMLAKKAELEKAGTWQVNNPGEGQNDATRGWTAAASMDLSGVRFMTRALADAPEKQAGSDEEVSAPPEGDVKTLVVEDDVIGFAGFIFPWRAWFESAQFHGLAWFESAQFHGEARFGSAQFHEQAWFVSAQFHELAGFESAQFHEQAWFWSAQFLGQARFGSAQFHGLAGFKNATFKASTSFRRAKFGDKKKRQDADFTGIKVERAFDMTGATFSKVPAFNQADFAQAPDLDDVRYPQPPFFRFWVRGWEDKEKTVRRADPLKADGAKYRHLRRLAILGHDHENESKAFKGETRAKRGTEHYPWHAAFWFGVLYDALSDFGRSMMRPFYVWAALVIAFAFLYLWTSNAPFDGCAATAAVGLGKNLAAWSEAAYLAVKNGLIVIGLGAESKINQAHACLYGGSIQEPVFPPGPSFAQVGQNLLSAPLIFLFLLAVRNQFKIK
ncbi:MAG: pentapeptide repeat-containing protein [Hyphomicrobiales bacterium]|nr:pentapeptide repeat-containing protein [Hyphomicrobiales bacterium]